MLSLSSSYESLQISQNPQNCIAENGNGTKEPKENLL
jgi:hypothetical protein